MTVKHYLGGQLAKENLLRRMYADLQRQIEFYVGEAGLGDVMVAPPDYMPAYLAEPELSEEEWSEYQQSLLGEGSVTTDINSQ